MAVWAQKMNKIQTPENTPRLFDLVKVKNEEIRQAFYFALRDTLVANNLDQATRVAYQRDRRWRVVTLQGQIIEQSGKWGSFSAGWVWFLLFQWWVKHLKLTCHMFPRYNDWWRKQSDERKNGFFSC